MVVTSRSVRRRTDPLVDGVDIVVAGRDDAVASPELPGRGGGFVPLLLDADFDPVFAMLGVWQDKGYLVHGAATRSLRRQHHHAGGGKIAKLADHPLGHAVHDGHGRGDPLARCAALFEFAAHAWPAMRASCSPSRRRL